MIETDDVVELSLGAAMMTSLEVPSEVAEKAVPRALDVLEVRPGRALVSLVFFEVCAGCVHGEHGTLAGYTELALAVHVAPALARGVPRMSMFVVHMATSSMASQQFLRDVHSLRTYAEPIDARLEQEQMGVQIGDRRGPIVRMRSHHPQPTFQKKQVVGQIFTERAKRIAMYQEQISGEVHEHQSRHARVELFAHPFFEPLGEFRSSTPVTYMQMVSAPGTKLIQRAERPRDL